MSLEEGTYLSLFKGAIPFARRGVDPRPPGGMVGIMAQVEAEHGLWRGDLLRGDRSRKFAWPRQEFMWRCRQVRWPNGEYRYSLPQIADFLGLSDHTTVLYGVRRHAERHGLDLP